MTDSDPGHTVAGMFHHMYLANGERFHFLETLAELLGMDIANLRALYDLPAPDPRSPDFDGRVEAILRRPGRGHLRRPGLRARHPGPPAAALDAVRRLLGTVARATIACAGKAARTKRETYA